MLLHAYVIPEGVAPVRDGTGMGMIDPDRATEAPCG
jgi:hypothetical protein